MARTFKPDRPVRLEINLPMSVHSRLAVLLFSPTEGRVPHGAWSSFFEALARNALAQVQQPVPQAHQGDSNATVG